MVVPDEELADIIKAVGSEATAEWERLSCFEAYFRGRQDTPYKPKTATAEFNALVKKATTNLTRLVVHSLTQRLIVDGYKASPTDVDNAAPWDWWQANGLDGRQKSLYDEVGKCGYAYVMVLPGDEDPMMKPVSPMEWYGHFDAPDDDWPTVAVKRSQDQKAWWVLDDEQTRKVAPNPSNPALMTITERAAHNLGVTPLVNFRNEWTLIGRPVGEVEACIPIQDRLNQTCFDLLVAQTYAAAPQKWIAGLSAPVDEHGEAILNISAFAKSVWVDPNPDAKFGSLPEANLKNLVEAIENTLRMMGLATQTPPHYLLGSMVNLSAEALVAADSTMAKKVIDHQIIYGEAWEQAFRLAALAAGDLEAANDTNAQVRWRDTEPRSIAAVVDALGKMAQMLQVPPQALWEQVPGITNGDLELWRVEAARNRLTQAQAPPAPTPSPGGVPGSQPIAS